MKFRTLERTYGKSPTRIASELTALGLPVSKQAIHQWRLAGKVPPRSAAVIRALSARQAA